MTYTTFPTRPQDIFEDGYYWLHSEDFDGCGPRKFVARREDGHWYCCGVYDALETGFTNETVLCAVAPPPAAEEAELLDLLREIVICLQRITDPPRVLMQGDKVLETEGKGGIIPYDPRFGVPEWKRI